MLLDEIDTAGSNCVSWTPETYKTKFSEANAKVEEARALDRQLASVAAQISKAHKTDMNEKPKVPWARPRRHEAC